MAGKDAAKEKPTDRVVIHHPATGGQATVQRRSLRVWEPKGWKLGPAPDKKAGS